LRREVEKKEGIACQIENIFISIKNNSLPVVASETVSDDLELFLDDWASFSHLALFKRLSDTENDREIGIYGSASFAGYEM
jgi:hypothetical protein